MREFPRFGSTPPCRHAGGISVMLTRLLVLLSPVAMLGVVFLLAQKKDSDSDALALGQVQEQIEAGQNGFANLSRGDVDDDPAADPSREQLALQRGQGAVAVGGKM